VIPPWVTAASSHGLHRGQQSRGRVRRQPAGYDAEDREQPSEPAEIPGGEPEDDVLEQRQQVPDGDDER
jgi:hypothetical protein